MSDRVPVAPAALPGRLRAAARRRARRASSPTGWPSTSTRCSTRLDKNLRHAYGFDFGRSGDLSVCMPLAEERTLMLRAPFVLELRNVPFRQQEQILFHVVDRLPRFTNGKHDARGNGQFLAEYAQQRYGAEPDRGGDALPGLVSRPHAEAEGALRGPHHRPAEGRRREGRPPPDQAGARHPDGAGRGANARAPMAASATATRRSPPAWRWRRPRTTRWSSAIAASRRETRGRATGATRRTTMPTAGGRGGSSRSAPASEGSV